MKIKNINYLITNLYKIPNYLFQYYKFKKNININNKWNIKFTDMLPILDEDSSVMSFDSHYVYHTGWASRVLKEIGTSKLVDISSSIMFCSAVSAFIKVEHYDIRKTDFNLPGIECGQENLLNLSFNNNSIECLSCMHVIEHVGLGRYGDEININDDKTAANELIRVLSKNGFLLVVLPLGERSKIRFNAHRIYTFEIVINMFYGLTIKEFSFYNDTTNEFKKNALPSDILGSEYGCGCFVFQKI